MGIVDRLLGKGQVEQKAAHDAELVDLRGQMAAINRVLAFIEFGLDGRIITANDNFLQVLGFQLDEIRGQHHSLFVDPPYRPSSEYRQFWERLGRGQFDAGQYKRLGKGGREVWIQASYNPVFDANGQAYKVVKYATDITEDKRRAADLSGHMAAISKSQAVIEFSLDGRILTANENFLGALGYRLDEIRGQHHSLFVSTEYRQSPEYRQFWDKLGRGEYDAGQYMRVGKGGREIWIQASYNPILDADGKPFKVVKYATDVTAQVLASRALQRAVEETQAVVEAARDGDISLRIGLEDKSGEIATLCAGVNDVLETMAGVIGQVKESAEVISRAVSEIAQGNQDLSSRTEEQASSLEQTASSMEQLSGTVRQNADNARRANDLAHTSNDEVARGGEVVKRVVATMQEIQGSSKKISEIIGVIDSIAFQTNILALNAAVEAARAGEQGRGFAVVATEVRNLAQRSATAAKEIKALIAESVDKVDEGARLVAEAGSTMDQVVTSFRSVAGLVTEISGASREQSNGIEQVSKAVSQMDEVTQQNAALVEEAAAAAESLDEQVRGLVQTVARFSLTGGAGASGRVSRTPPSQRATPSAPRARAASVRKVANGAPVAAPASGDEWAEF